MTEPTKFRFHPSQNYNIKTQNCVKFKALIICRLQSAEKNNIDARKKLTICNLPLRLPLAALVRKPAYDTGAGASGMKTNKQTSTHIKFIFQM